MSAYLRLQPFDGRQLKLPLAKADKMVSSYSTNPYPSCQFTVWLLASHMSVLTRSLGGRLTDQMCLKIKSGSLPFRRQTVFNTDTDPVADVNADEIVWR